MIGTVLDEIQAAAVSGLPTAIAAVNAARGVALATTFTVQPWFDYQSEVAPPSFPMLSLRWTGTEAGVTLPAAGVRDGRHKLTLAYVYKSTTAADVALHMQHMPEALLHWLDSFPTVNRSSAATIRQIAAPFGQQIAVRSKNQRTRESNGQTSYLWIAEIDLEVSARDVVVPPVPVASVTVAAQGGVTSTLDFLQLTATVKDANGNTLTGRAVSWASADPSTATVDNTGLVTGIQPGGPITIVATCEGVVGTITVTILVPVASLTFSPSPLTVGVGQQQSISVTAKDANGNTLTGRTVALSSSNTSIATVSPARGASTLLGTVTGVALGSATITATCEGVSAQLATTVSAVFAYGVTAAAVDLWLDASQLALADGAAVASWAGREGNYTAAQGSNPAAPTFALSVPIVNMKGVRFTRASSQGLYIPNYPSVAGLTGLTLFLVVRSNSLSNPQQEYFCPAIQNLRFGVRTTTGGVFYGEVTGGSAYGTWAPSSDTYILSWRYDGTAVGNSGRLRLWALPRSFTEAEQTLTYTGTIPASVAGAATAGCGIGTQNGAEYADAWIMESLVWRVALSDADRASVAAQLKTKWGF